jgi:prefoldin subunit 5
MATTHEDLSLRLDRLEHDVRELSSALARPVASASMNDLSFRGWLKISGPTFAVMVFGFGLLWSAQQAQSAQLLEVTRITGRLEGAITGLDSRVQTLEGAVLRLDERIGKLDARIDKLDARIGELDARIDKLDARIGELDARIDKLDQRIDKLGAAVDKLAERVGLQS